MNLKKFRMMRGNSQAEIASLLNIQTQTYQNYELGKRQPNLEILSKLADIYNTDIDSLVRGEEVIYYHDYQKALINEVKNLSEVECAKVHGFIKGLKQ